MIGLIGAVGVRFGDLWSRLALLKFIFGLRPLRGLELLGAARLLVCVPVARIRILLFCCVPWRLVVGRLLADAQGRVLLRVSGSDLTFGGSLGFSLLRVFASGRTVLSFVGGDVGRFAVTLSGGLFAKFLAYSGLFTPSLFVGLVLRRRGGLGLPVRLFRSGARMCQISAARLCRTPGPRRLLIGLGCRLGRSVLTLSNA